MGLVENCNSYALYRREDSHAVLKGFLLSKNTAAVDILLFKFGGDVICELQTLKCHTVICSKA